jgi:geranylgeranyl pyrophosphate synthase
MDFKTQLQSRVEGINQILAGCLPQETGLQKTGLEAMNYSVNDGGKRLRRMLLSVAIIYKRTPLIKERNIYISATSLSAFYCVRSIQA